MMYSLVAKLPFNVNIKVSCLVCLVPLSVYPCITHTERHKNQIKCRGVQINYEKDVP